MNDLISKGQLFNALAAAQDKGEIFAIIQDMPTVDAEKVIRCADCRFFICNLRPDGYLPEGVGETECTLFHFGADYTDFCSKGERRKNGS